MFCLANYSTFRRIICCIILFFSTGDVLCNLSSYILTLCLTNQFATTGEMILTRRSCWLVVGGWDLTGRGGGYRVTQEENWEGGGSLFLSLRAPGKKGREPEQSREVQTNWGEMDGGGGTGARALLIGRLWISLCGWIDLARVELHHLPCISLFFS